MYCVYDGLTGTRLSFEYPSRAEAQHVADSIRYSRFNTIVLNTRYEVETV